MLFQINLDILLTECKKIMRQNYLGKNLSLTFECREKLCNLTKQGIKKVKIDNYKYSDYMIHLVHASKLKIIKAPLVD